MRQALADTLSGRSKLEGEDGFCRWCRPATLRSELCESVSQGWRCTRDVGHPLPHIACGVSGSRAHHLFEWPTGKERATSPEPPGAP